MGHDDHKKQADDSIGCVIITCSDTRSEDTDESGKLIRELLTEAGHKVAGYVVLKDEPADIAAHVRAQFGKEEVQAVIVNGGTGVSVRDSTFEAIDALLEKRLPGFGEIFRHLSFLEIGSSAMLSRATCGVAQGCAIFSVPGSVSAVRLAMTRLILPELAHLVWVARPAPKHGAKHGRHGHKH